MRPIHGVFAPTLGESAKGRSELGELLAFLRRRMDPGARVLGSYARVSPRLGKRVTQEELAEAIGVGREWYVQLERGTARTRASTGLLKRLADALMVTPEERTMLFRLALPEVGRIELREESLGVLEAFSRLRSLAKALWSATSIDDVLMTASEQVANWFDGALLVRPARRRESASWDGQALDDRQDQNRVSKAMRNTRELLATSQSPFVQDLLRRSALFDTVNYLAQVPNAGDLGSLELWPLPLRRELLKGDPRHHICAFDCRYARVRSRNGFIGGLYVVHVSRYSHSASNLAVLSAFAELTSFALS